MGRYSSDSESSTHRHRSRRRWSSSRSSDSDVSNRRRRRSASRSRSQKSSSRRKKSYRRSRSPRDRKRNRHRSKSRERNRRRSRSSDRHSRSKKTRSSSSEKDTRKDDIVREKLWKAIKAAEIGVDSMKQPKSENVLEPDAKPDAEVLKSIEDDGEFVPKSFKSSLKNVAPEDCDVMDIPTAKDLLEIDSNSVFHSNLFVDSKTRIERWTRKLFQIRQRALEGLS